MSFWSRLFGATREVASPWTDRDHLTQITGAGLFPGYDPDLAPLTRSQAMAVPAVAAARHRVVGTLSRLPLLARNRNGSEWTDAVGLIVQPDPAETQAHTLAKTLDDLFFDGIGYWGVTAYYSFVQSGGSPTLYRPMSAVHIPLACVRADSLGRMHVDPAFVQWLNRSGRQLLTIPNAGDRPWLIRFDNFHPGLLSFGNRGMRTADKLDQAVEKIATNPVPAIELHQTSGDPLSDAEATALINKWDQNRRRTGVGYTNESLEVKTHGLAPEHLLINARNQQSVEIARLAGIPASAIDAAVPGTSLTYANLRDRVTDLVNFGLTPYAGAIEGRLSMPDCTPAGVRVGFDYASLFPADEASSSPTPTPEAAPIAAQPLETAP